MANTNRTESSESSAFASTQKQRLEYLAKIKYHNVLPPPPFPPRLVDYELDTSELLNAGSLSSVFLQRPINPEVDIELGIPLDLSVLDVAFDPEKSYEAMCPVERDENELDPEDIALLGEPEISGVATAGRGSFASIVSSNTTPLGRTMGDGIDEAAPSSSEIGMGTSFLRRTAYVSGDTRRSARRKTGGANIQKASKESVLEAEIRRIEQTFEDAQVPLSSLQHPSKCKNVHAVKAIPLFPDLKDTDLTFAEVRLVGSASLRSHTDLPSKEQLRAAVFHHRKAEDDDYEWTTLFVPKSIEDAQLINKYRQELRDALPAQEAQEEEQSEFALHRLQANEVNILMPRHQFEEVVISQNGDESFIYKPVSARYNLTRRRLDTSVQKQLKSFEIDVLDLGLRELSAQESIDRDEVRSIFDPVNYG